MTSLDQQHDLEHHQHDGQESAAPEALQTQPLNNSNRSETKRGSGKTHGARRPKNKPQTKQKGPPRDAKLACLIAKRLAEPKIQLLHRVVRILGNKTAWKLFQETLRIEQSGGIYIDAHGVALAPSYACATGHTQQAGATGERRRRTSGGVFLGLVKQHATKDEYQRIYEVELQKKKAARKRIRFQKKKKLEKALDGLGFEHMEIEDQLQDHGQDSEDQWVEVAHELDTEEGKAEEEQDVEDGQIDDADMA